MIITRTWLNNFIDIRRVSNERLYEIFNNVGLEVDNIKSYTIPRGVVIGEIISCQKHPDADKLTICQINIGSGIEQIVCGASNVTKARFVAVATIGTKLKGDFEIKPTTIRGVKKIGTDYSATLSH